MVAFTNDCYRLFALAFLTLLLAAPAPVSAQDGAEAYEYDIHSASPPASSVDGRPTEYRNVRVMHALQGPDVTLLWQEDEEHTLENAGFARYQKEMGLLMPGWALDRSAAPDTGWTSLGRTLQYDAFQADIRRGGDDRTIAGHPAKHYVFEAQLTKQVEGSSRKQRFDVTTNLWMLEDRPFSWAPFSVFGTQSVNADPRLRAALAERLADRGLLARAETDLSFEMLAADGSPAGGSESRQVVWIEDLKPAEPPQVEMPMISAAAARTLNAEITNDPQAFCKAVLEGTAPAFVQEVLSAAQQSVFLEYARSRCK